MLPVACTCSTASAALAIALAAVLAADPSLMRPHAPHAGLLQQRELFEGVSELQLMISGSRDEVARLDEQVQGLEQQLVELRRERDAAAAQLRSYELELSRREERPLAQQRLHGARQTYAETGTRPRTLDAVSAARKRARAERQAAANRQGAIQLVTALPRRTSLRHAEPPLQLTYAAVGGPTRVEQMAQQTTTEQLGQLAESELGAESNSRSNHKAKAPPPKPIIETSEPLPTSWPGVRDALCKETPPHFLLELGRDRSKGTAAFNSLVSPPERLGDHTPLPKGFRGQLQARGLHGKGLAYMFGRLMVAASARHLMAGGSPTDLITFRTNSKVTAVWATHAGLCAVREAAMSLTEEQLKQRPMCSGTRPQPQWGKMALMKAVGFETGAEGLPLFDFHKLGDILNEDQEAEFLASLANLLHDLSECAEPEGDKIDIKASIRRFKTILDVYHSLQ